MEDELFELEYENRKINVQTTTIQKQVLFRIIFPDRPKPIVICKAVNERGIKFWTCIPESVPNQIQAEKIGPLIETYYRIKLKK